MTLCELGCSAVVARDTLKLMSERCFLVLTHRESLIVLGYHKDNTRREARVSDDREGKRWVRILHKSSKSERKFVIFLITYII